jgi:glycosyltransferase involved in cell wall biosynthesis
MIKVVSYITPSAAGLYRIEQIFKYLNRTKRFQCTIAPHGVTDATLQWADLVVIHELIDPAMIAMVWAYKMERNKKVIVDRDDMVVATDSNPYKERHTALNAPIWRRELLKIADKVTVTTKTIKDEVSKYNENVRILPNYLDMEMWDIPVVPNETGMIRIGWQGSVSHREDLMIALPAVKRILKEFPNTKFVFCGDDFLFQHLKDVNPAQYEYVLGTMEYHMWPRLEHTLSFDIGIAPLVDNLFNHGKSNLKWLEYGMIRAAGVYSPAAYKGTVKEGKTGFIAKTEEEWYLKLKLLVTSSVTRKYIADNAYKEIHDRYSIKEHIGAWASTYRNTLQGSR